tara:strand:+ start:7220 stop:7687 length:468 start_codon:yes stop_codon:yes gene_type:complete
MNTVASMNTDELRKLYRELIVDHARTPRHFGALDTATHTAEGINPLCGDKLHLYLQIDTNGVINDAAFEGTGCAISLASASLMTDTIIGLHSKAAMAWFDQVTASLAGEQESIAHDKLNALQGVREFPSRVKCATLAWHALRCAINNDTTATKTE